MLLIPALWWTAEEELMDVHIAARPDHARPGPVPHLLGPDRQLDRALRPLREGSRRDSAPICAATAKPAVGHNPLGALSVLALLLLLAVQVGLGLFASDDDGLYQGPLSHHVSYDASETLAERHETMFNVLLVFIGLHLAAILFYPSSSATS